MVIFPSGKPLPAQAGPGRAGGTAKNPPKKNLSKPSPMKVNVSQCNQM
jgi:hypothetical protein